MTRLSSELAAYHETDGFGMIRHPLVYAVPFFDTPEEVARLNRVLETKKALTEKARDAKDWDQYIFLHERPYRINAFEKVQAGMGDECYWRILGRVWIDAENIYHNRMLWWIMLTTPRRKRHLFSDVPPAEIRKLPRELIIYRGTTAEERDSSYLGFSWTLDHDRASWFAYRFQSADSTRVPVLVSARMDRKNIVGLLRGRGEDEIVATSSALRDIQWNELGA